MQKNKTSALVIGGLIAASYAALTYFCALFGLSFGALQLRLSEALCVLVLIFPEAVGGLAVGCLISNIVSPLGIFDIIFGTAATLLASLLMREFKNIKIRDIPVVSIIFPALVNGIIIGAEVAVLTGSDKSFLVAFLIPAAEIFIGELIVTAFLGIPLYKFVKRYVDKKRK